MFALVNKSDNSITKMLSGNQGITIGDNQYPKAIFTIWTESERNAINIYTITIDNSKRKDERIYSGKLEMLKGFCLYDMQNKENETYKQIDLVYTNQLIAIKK